MEEILASIRRIISDDGDDTLLPPTVKPGPSVSTEAIDALFGARAPVEDDPIPSFLRQEQPKPEPVRAAEPARTEPPRAAEPRPRPRIEMPPTDGPERAAARPEPVRAEPWRAESSRPDPARAETQPRPAAPAPARPLPSSAEREADLQTPPQRRASDPAEELPSGRQLLSPMADAAVSASFGDLANTLLSGQARTLEDLVKDMLRPMLKAWLDTNLPPLVERLVRDEIERVSRGR